jgi:DNA-binding Xre family transcriptional regulator
MLSKPTIKSYSPFKQLSKRRIPSEVSQLDEDRNRPREPLDLRKLGKEVQRLRQEKDIGQISFAYEVQISSPKIATFESGKTPDIHISKLDRIARGLGMKLSELIALVEKQ